MSITDRATELQLMTPPLIQLPEMNNVTRTCFCNWGVAPAASTGSRIERPLAGQHRRWVGLTGSCEGPPADLQPTGRMSVSCDELPGRRPFQFGLSFWCAGAGFFIGWVCRSRPAWSVGHLQSGCRLWRGRTPCTQRCNYSEMPAWCRQTWLCCINMHSACTGRHRKCYILCLAGNCSCLRLSMTAPGWPWCMVPVWILFTRAISIPVVLYITAAIRLVTGPCPAGQPLCSGVDKNYLVNIWNWYRTVYISYVLSWTVYAASLHCNTTRNSQTTVFTV